MKLALSLGVLASLCTVLLAQSDEDVQLKKLIMKKKVVKLEVALETVTYEIAPTPILNIIANKGTLVEGCVIQQGELIENTTMTTSFVGKFPMGMEGRWHTWLNYKDGQFLLYREDKYRPFTITQFSRAGMLSDNLDIDLSIISGKEGDQIKFMRDITQENAPSSTRNVATYIYVHPNNIIYHEINFLGKSVKTKAYKTDNQLELIDSFAINKKLHVVTGGSLEIYNVDANTMVKEYETLIPVNSISQISYTRGKLYLFVKRVDGMMHLVANTKFSLENAYLHLKAKYIKLMDSGNRNLVVFVQDDPYDKFARYYYIENPKANKSSSLVFAPIPELKKIYNKAFELKGRIHFIMGTEHAMYTKGGKTTTVSLKNTLPILGLSFWSYYQYLQEDKFVLVADINPSGNLKLVQASLTTPKVVCPPRIGSVEKYEKFSVLTKDYEYQFEVMFQTTGTQDFVNGTIFDQIVCVMFGVAIAGGVFLWFKKSLNDRDFKRFNAALKKKRGLTATVVQEGPDQDGDLMDQIEEIVEKDGYDKVSELNESSEDMGEMQA